VGAGAAGLMAAWELASSGKKTLVLEARDRVGGRIHSIYGDHLFEAGAEFVHGDLPITNELINHDHLKLKDVKGSIWQKKEGQLCKQEDFIEDYSLLEKKFKELKKDISVEKFFQQYLADAEYEQIRYTLKNYVEGYYAGTIAEVSTMALCRELSESSDEQFRISQGYQAIADFLYRDCIEKGCLISMNSIVEHIEWERNHVLVHSSGNEVYAAEKIMITIPVGLLKVGAIRFTPALTEKLNIANLLGYGPVIKVILQFTNAFWRVKEVTENKDLSDLSFMFSSEKVPTWWTQFPDTQPVLTGWIAGPHAEKMKHDTKDLIVTKAMYSLCDIFGLEAAALHKELVNAHVFNWATDPFTLGGYSFQVVNGSTCINEFLKPVQHTIYFAGEGLIDGPEIGTVEGALRSGRDCARAIISQH
jgi:monoamine oxidase